MVKAYSLDLRARVIRRIKLGKGSHQQIADDFEIGVATLRRWIKLYQETGSFNCKVPTVTRPRKVNYEEVQKFIENNPDQTLKEIGEKFGVKDTTILYIMKRLNITYKKTLPLLGTQGRFAGRVSKSLKSNSKRESDLS